MAKSQPPAAAGKKGVTGTSSGALAKVEPQNGALANRPAFLATKQVVGVEGLGRFVQMPLFKIVQPQSTKLLEKFDAGDVVFMAEDSVLAEIVKDGKGKYVSSTPFHFVPLLFYTEYCGWNDIDKHDAPAIFVRSFDENSEVAKKAMDVDSREEPDPEDESLTRTYSEHLNFVIRIYEHGHPLDGKVGVLSFARGNHKDGRKLGQLIKMRGQSPFACVFEARTSKRTKDNYTWFGLDMSNPSEESGVDPWVQDEQLFNELEQQHEGLRQLIKGDRLRADLDKDRDQVKPADEGTVEDDV